MLFAGCSVFPHIPDQIFSRHFVSVFKLLVPLSRVTKTRKSTLSKRACFFFQGKKFGAAGVGGITFLLA